MENNDTIYLLKECDAGSKMAVTSIDEVMDRVRDKNMKELLRESREHHEQLGNDIHSQLMHHHSEEKDPNPMAKGMSWLKVNTKMALGGDDTTAAYLVADGCDMGVKSLCRSRNRYPNAEQEAKYLAEQLINCEETLSTSLRPYF